MVSLHHRNVCIPRAAGALWITRRLGSRRLTNRDQHWAVKILPETSSSASTSALVARPPQRPAAFFDLDKTVIAASSTTVFSRQFYSRGLISKRDVLRSAYTQFVYLLGGADHDQTERMREYLSTLVTGWPVEQVREIVGKALHENIDPVVYAEALELIRSHQAAGIDVIIVSASGSEVVEPIARLLRVDRVVATKLVEEDGKFTGEIEYYAYGPEKARAVERLAAEHNYDLAASWAYSDSITDVPLLEAVGHPYAVNPDRALRRIATERGWPVLTFRRPIRLRDRFAESGPQLTTGAVIAGAIVGAIVWGTLRSRRKARA